MSHLCRAMKVALNQLLDDQGFHSELLRCLETHYLSANLVLRQWFLDHLRETQREVSNLPTPTKPQSRGTVLHRLRNEALKSYDIDKPIMKSL